MGQVIGELLPLGLGVAISPIPIIAVVLMLFSPQALRIGTAYAVGWFVGVVLVLVVLTLVANATGMADGGEPSALAGWVKLLLGLALLALGIRQWRGRPAPGETARLPGWMSAIDRITGPRAAGLGLALTAVNPKNLAMSVGAAVTLAGGGLSAGGSFAAGAIFVLLAVSTVVGPVAAYAVAGDRMRGPLLKLRSWLEANNAAVMSVLFLVLGVVLVGKGIGVLF